MDPKTAQRIIDCDPKKATPAVRKKPFVKKPRTEVVVQAGPFTDSSVSTPDTYQNLSGPTELLIKPDTGEIGPFDSTKPVPENVIRKYITVQAQDNDVPNDLPNSGSGDYILRELPAVVGLDADPDNKVVTRVEYVRESYTTSTVTAEEVDPLPQEECPPCDCEAPVVEEPEVEEPVIEEPECEKPPACEKPVVEEPLCEEPPICDEPPVVPTPLPPAIEEPECDEKPIEPEPACEEPVKCEDEPNANNDLANTRQNTPVTIDVLRNDSGCDPLCITSAHADNGLVEILEGKLVYTPEADFHGNDVINYTISDHGCLTDDATVFVTVSKEATPTAPVVEAPECVVQPVDECAKAAEQSEPGCEPKCESEGELNCETASSCNIQSGGVDLTHSTTESITDSITDPIKDGIFERTERLLDEIFSRTSTVMEKVESTRSAWTEALDSSWGKAGAVAACEDVAVVA